MKPELEKQFVHFMSDLPTSSRLDNAYKLRDFTLDNIAALSAKEIGLLTAIVFTLKNTGQTPADFIHLRTEEVIAASREANAISTKA